MNTLGEIYAKRDWWERRLRRAQERREIANKTVDRCYDHLGPTVLVSQITELLKPYFPEHDLEVLGPFGLASEMAIHVQDPTSTEHFKTVGSLTFRYHGAQEPPLTLVDRSRDSGRYASNTIGSINGLNYPDKKVPETIEELASLLRASIDTE
jgi:hypothetical protein